MAKFCYIDFEYNKSYEARRNLVSVSVLHNKELGIKKIWLYNDDKTKTKFKKWLKVRRAAGCIFIAFNVEAEAGSFISLGLDPTTFKWIDLQKEWRLLTNHWDKYNHGKQLLDGKIKKTYNPILKRNLTQREIDKRSWSKAKPNLASAVYKMTGRLIDTEHKNKIRDLIIHMTEEPSEEDKKTILDYNASDVEVLPELFEKIKEAYKAIKAPIKANEILYRGEVAAHTALIECRGYPVAKTIRNFAANTHKILAECAKDINEQFPEQGFFEYDKKTGRYTMKRKPQQDFIASCPFAKKWVKTKTGYTSKLEEWVRHYGYKSPYPRNIIPAQIIRYLRLKQSLNGFLPKAKNAKNKETFFSSLGTDYRVRPHLGGYGSQSSRFQPKATSYIPLKASWLRYFIQPKPGKAICGIDYKSQEFLIAALLSGDKKMQKAYLTSDVYLAFGKDAKIIPEDADKSHPKRLVCKSTVLGIQYLMGEESLANKIELDSGEPCSVNQARNYIDIFNQTYKQYSDWRWNSIKKYERQKYLKLADGWCMGPDNGNHRSVANCPVQGMGAVILRKAIINCHKAKLKPIMPLHDALYVEITTQDEIDLFKQIMIDSFVEAFGGIEEAKSIMIDVYAWGKDVNSIVTDKSIHTMKHYLEDRSIDEFNRFKKYFLIGES